MTKRPSLEEIEAREPSVASLALNPNTRLQELIDRRALLTMLKERDALMREAIKWARVAIRNYKHEADDNNLHSCSCSCGYCRGRRAERHMYVALGETDNWLNYI